MELELKHLKLNPVTVTVTPVIPNGAWIQCLPSRLWECNLQKPTVPLFLTTMGNLGYRLVSPGVPVSKPFD